MIFGRCFDVLESLMPNKRVGYTKGIVEPRNKLYIPELLVIFFSKNSQLEALVV